MRGKRAPLPGASEPFILSLASTVCSAEFIRTSEAETPVFRPCARFGLLEKSFGLNFNPHGLLSNEALRGFVDPVRTMTWDWAHSFLQDGAFTTEVILLLKACEPFGETFPTLRDFLKGDRWRFPKATKAKSAGLYRVFDAWRSSSGDANQAMPRKYVSAERLRLGFHERCAFCFPKEGLLAMFRQRQGTGGSSGCTS